MSSFDKKVGGCNISHEYTVLQVVKAKVTEKDKKENGKEVKIRTFKEINNAKTDVLKATLTSSELGQELAFSYQRGGNAADAKDQIGRILATFTMTKNFELSLKYKTEFEALEAHTFKPLITAFPGIEAQSIADVFSQWLCTPEFFQHLKIISCKGGYTPALVKMLVLYMSYQDVKADVLEKVGQFSKDMVIDINEVARVFRANMIELKSDIPRMAKHYSSDLMLLPASDSPLIVGKVDQPEPIVGEPAIDPDITEDDQEILSVEPETVETEPNTEIVKDQEPAIEVENESTATLGLVTE